MRSTSTTARALTRGVTRWFSHLVRTSAFTTGMLAATWGPTLTQSFPTPTANSADNSMACIQTATRSKSCGAFSTTAVASSTTLSAGRVLQTSLEKAMTKDAVDIVRHSIQAVDPSQAVKTHFRWNADDNRILQIGTDTQVNIQDYEEIVLVAFGKASSAMATAILEQLYYSSSDQEQRPSLPPSSGVVICKDDHAKPDEVALLEEHGVVVKMASHPVPDTRSASAAAQILEVVKAKAKPNNLVLCAISGGGSALFCQPTPPLTLENLQQVNSVLLGAGMGIQEMNVIRKRLEEGKGGRLAAAAHPSQLVALVLSDVLGDPLDLIASGPTVPDTSSFADAWTIIESYQLQDKLPPQVIDILQQGLEGDLPDSPAADHPVFETATTTLVGNNALAVKAAAERAQALGYHPVVLGTQIEGEAKEIAHMYVGMAQHLQATNGIENPLRTFSLGQTLPIALIAGGETTVSLPTDGPSGKGGRNQELALAAASLLEKGNLRNIVVASVGTDGTDGPTDAAGAVVDGSTLLRGTTDEASSKRQLEEAQRALQEHNAYPFFKLLHSAIPDEVPPPLIITGPTGTNVADICVTLIGPSPDSK